MFDSLPPDIQYELLTSYKDALKAKKSQSFNEFPEVIMIYHKKNVKKNRLIYHFIQKQSEDFSLFQMKSLLHKGEISSQINNLKNSMKKQHTSKFHSIFR